MSIRLDELAAKQFGVSEQEATALIMEGRVWMGHIPADKPGTTVKDDTVLTLRDKAKKYASRSGYKLEKALHVFPFDVEGKDVCDIGASNGGFTDCMLQYGAKHVWSVDVAYGILEWRLRCDERVTVMERTNARKLTEEMLGQKVDRITADVSFISLTKLFPAMNDILKDDGLAMLLIKPQFEAPQKALGKNGIVKDRAILPPLVLSIADSAVEHGLYLQDLAVSPIHGQNGNVEYIALFSRAQMLTDDERNALVEGMLEWEPDEG